MMRYGTQRFMSDHLALPKNIVSGNKVVFFTLLLSSCWSREKKNRSLYFLRDYVKRVNDKTAKKCLITISFIGTGTYNMKRYPLGRVTRAVNSINRELKQRRF